MNTKSYGLLAAAIAMGVIFALNPAMAAPVFALPIVADPATASLTLSMLGMSAAPRVRGIVSGLRADASVNTALVAELNTAFAAFKVENDKRLTGVEKKFDDVVQNEHVDRINATITKIQNALEDQARRMASLSVAEGAGLLTPEAKAHAEGFNKFLRKGVDAGLHDLEVSAALRTNSDPDGGYVVPEEMDSVITRVQSIYSSMRSLARVVNVGSVVFKKLHNKGGTDAGWVGETDARPETQTSKLAEISFPTMELYANPATTQTMLDDASIDTEGWLAEEVAIAFAEKEGPSFVTGTGVAQPRGLLSYDTIANASYAWGSLGFIVTTAAADFAASNPSDQLIDLYHALKVGLRANGTWLMNDLTLAKVRKFKDSTGQYIWQPGLQAGAPSVLLGRPVATDDTMPSVGSNTFPVAFGDFKRGYLITDRIGVRVLRDPFTNKPYVMFYTTKRVGGGIADFEAIKLLKCST